MRATVSALEPPAARKCLFQHLPPRRHFSSTPSLHVGRPAVTMEAKLKEVTLDDAIDTPEVQIKTDNGLSEPRSLWQVLRSINRSTTHVVQVSKPGDREIAIVKIMDRREIIRSIVNKEEAARKASLLAKSRKPKQLELNWAIAPNDLQLKLNQMESFLKQGKKVELLLAAKRHQRKATQEEAKSVLKTIRDRIDAAGAKESKPADGKLLGQVVMFIEKPPLQ